MTPDTPPSRPHQHQPESPDAFLGEKLSAVIRYRQTYDYALDIGLTPTSIVRYALAELSEHDRPLVEEQLVRSTWAMQRVVALIRAHRRGLDPARPILYPDCRSHVWRDEDLEGCKLLDTI